MKSKYTDFIFEDENQNEFLMKVKRYPVVDETNTFTNFIFEDENQNEFSMKVKRYTSSRVKKIFNILGWNKSYENKQEKVSRIIEESPTLSRTIKLYGRGADEGKESTKELSRHTSTEQSKNISDDGDDITNSTKSCVLSSENRRDEKRHLDANDEIKKYIKKCHSDFNYFLENYKYDVAHLPCTVHRNYKDDEGTVSISPEKYNNIHSEFIINSCFKKEYLKECLKNNIMLERKSKNMVPILIVFEFDDSPLDEQIELALNLCNSKYKDYIYSITSSGGKSLHITIKINGDEFNNIVKENSNEFFKILQDKIADIIFDSQTITYKNKRLLVVNSYDKKCSTIGRLTRFPNHFRENGKQQKSYYINYNVKDFPIDINVEYSIFNIKNTYRNKSINNININNKLNKSIETLDDIIKFLENTYNKNKKENARIALDLYNNIDPGQGINPKSLVGYCYQNKIPRYFVEIILNTLSDFHPSNLCKQNISNLLKNYIV